MTDLVRPAPLPRLAYVYHPMSVSPLTIVDSAKGVCDLVWVVDSSQPGSTSMQRLLRRSGPIVEAAGREVADVAVELRALAVDGVVSLHDGDLVWTARLAAELGLPFHSVETAIRLTDKAAQRAALGAAGLPVPAVHVIPLHTDEEELELLGTQFPFPAVLKPREGQSSRDTLPIASPAELLATMAEFRTRTEPTAAEFILESCIPDPSTPLGGEGFAPFVSVEGIVENGRVAHATITSRTPFRWPFRETGLATPTVIEPGLQQEILRVATEAALAVGVTIGCLHTEIKLTAVRAAASPSCSSSPPASASCGRRSASPLETRSTSPGPSTVLASGTSSTCSRSRSWSSSTPWRGSPSWPRSRGSTRSSSSAVPASGSPGGRAPRSTSSTCQGRWPRSTSCGP